jgi:hypothetical protein
MSTCDIRGRMEYVREGTLQGEKGLEGGGGWQGEGQAWTRRGRREGLDDAGAPMHADATTVAWKQYNESF